MYPEFNLCASNITLYVPEGCYEAYRDDPFWGQFLNIVEENPAAGIVDLDSDESTETVIYDLNGRKVNPDKLRPGIYIRNGKKVVIK